MAHWAELDENNVVIRVVVTDNEDPNGDEGYQWLLDNLEGIWVKTSFNSYAGVHYTDSVDASGNPIRVPSGKPHLRYNFASVDFTYDPDADAFYSAKPQTKVSESGDWELQEDFTWLWIPTGVKENTI